MEERKAQDKLNAIHAILNEFEGEEAVKRIREVLYGEPTKWMNE